MGVVFWNAGLFAWGLSQCLGVTRAARGSSWRIGHQSQDSQGWRSFDQELSKWIVCNAMKRGKMLSCCPYLSMLPQFVWFSIFKSRHAAGGAGFSTVCLCWNLMFVLHSIGEELKRSAITSSLSKVGSGQIHKHVWLEWIWNELKWYEWFIWMWKHCGGT